MPPGVVDALGRRNPHVRRRQNEEAAVNTAALAVAEDLQVRDPSGWPALDG